MLHHVILEGPLESILLATLITLKDLNDSMRLVVVRLLISDRLLFESINVTMITRNHFNGDVC